MCIYFRDWKNPAPPHDSRATLNTQYHTICMVDVYHIPSTMSNV